MIERGDEDRRRDPETGSRESQTPDFFDFEGSDPELLNSGRIPDPAPAHTPLFRWMAGVLTALEARLRARGAQPLRMLIRFFWLLITAAGLFLLLGPVINAPLDIDEIVASADIEEVDWVARDVDIDYSVQRAEDGRFAAEVTEAFTAHFLNDASASAINRAVVTEFHGHDVRFALRSATIDGAEAVVRIDRGPAMTTIRIMPDGGQRLDGTHEVTLEYELHNLVTSRVDEATGRTVDEWSWPLFASWPQATAGIEASFTFSREVDDALIRAPRAYVGWLLLSATERLEAEAETAEWVRYSFSNDQNLPPNADFWIDASFAPGTFAQPPTTALFWVQSWGPLLPLGLLGVLLLFALAARRVVWADSAGRPWYLARSEPPGDLPPELAVRLLRRPWHAELIEALRVRPHRKRSANPSADPGARSAFRDSTEGGIAARRERWLRHLAQAGRRAGRLGALPTVLAQRARWSSGNDPIVERGLRWIPDSYVRDTFLLAPIAITLVQWGLLRQLSHQVILTVVWWPLAFVLVSTALAILTVLAVRKPRPLTPEGAIALQELKGVDVYARATRLLDRGPLDDPLFPYAALFARPRRAGDAVTESAAREAGDADLARGWRTDRFVSASALGALAAALAILAGAVFWVSAQPAPYASDTAHVTRFDDLPGTFYTQVTGFEIEAELARGADGRAILHVLERHTVEFEGTGARVPQFAREWPSSRLGQDLGIEQVSMRIDGEEVPIREGEQPAALSRYAVTQLEEVLAGVHEVEVAYTLTNPVVAARNGPEDIEQLRWTAWYFFWEDEYYTHMENAFDGTAPVRPIRVQFTLAADLLEAVSAGGWIDSDHDRPQVPGEFGNWFAPWVYEQDTYLGDFDDSDHYELRIGSETIGADGSLTVSIDADEVQSRLVDVAAEAEADPVPWSVDEKVNAQLGSYELDLGTDIGVRLDFPAGTFSGIDPAAYGGYRFAYAAPYAALLGLAGLVLAASVGVIAHSVRLRGRGRHGGASFGTIAYLAIPIAALAQCVLFFWVVGPMPGSDPRIPAALAAGGLMLVAVVTEMVFASRTARTAHAPGAKSSRGR